MKASVYRLRDCGIKLPRPTEPRAGNVVLAVSDRGDRKYLKAQLLDGDRDLLPPLLQAQVTRITRNGLVLKGLEMTSRVPGSMKAKISTHAQTWWVLVHTADLTELYDDMDPLDDIMARKNDPLRPAAPHRPAHSRPG